MISEKVLRITGTIAIPLSEFRFRFTRSSGPGGQHVNRSATQVELLFDVANSLSLNEAQRQRVLNALASYIDKDGVLHLSSQTFRSQWRNREAVMERLRALMRKALRVPKRRRPTQPPPQAHQRRLAVKRRRGEIKKQRQRVASDNGVSGV